MRLSVEQYAEALHELGQKEGVSKMLTNFRALLKRRGEEGRLGAILEALVHKEEESLGILRLTVTTKYEASHESRAQIQKKAESVFPHKKVELVYTIDTKVLGGFKLQGREVIYDSTLAQSLKNISQTLKS